MKLLEIKMAEKNEYSYKLNEVYHAAEVHTSRLMETYAEEYAYRASEEEGESEQKKVLKFFAETILSGVADALREYFDDDEVYEMLDSTEFLRESKKIDKPSLREAQKRVALIAGKKKLNEQFSSTDEEQDAVEKFCILMDWEVEPEDVLHCVKNSDGKFTIQINDGTQFTYDPVNDCLVD